MTSELEQEFFEAFGIKTFIYCSKPKLDCNSRKNNTCTKDCEFNSGVLYPSITDRRLLELILLRATKYMGTVIELKPNSNIKDLKAEILQYFIKYKTEFDKQQIQQLFKEEE